MLSTETDTMLPWKQVLRVRVHGWLLKISRSSCLVLVRKFKRIFKKRKVMAMFFTKEKFIFDQWKFSGDLLTFSEPSSFWISLIVSLGMHTFAFNCFKMTKLTSFRQHLFEDDSQTFTAVFISLKIFIITSLSKIYSMCSERKRNYTEGRNNCCVPCFFLQLWFLIRHENVRTGAIMKCSN